MNSPEQSLCSRGHQHQSPVHLVSTEVSELNISMVRPTGWHLGRKENIPSLLGWTLGNSAGFPSHGAEAGVRIAKEKFEAGLSRVIGPVLLPWGGGGGFGSSSCAWKGCNCNCFGGLVQVSAPLARTLSSKSHLDTTNSWVNGVLCVGAWWPPGRKVDLHVVGQQECHRVSNTLPSTPATRASVRTG